MSLRLVRRPKSPHWIVRGTIREIRVEESSGTSDKRVAEEIKQAQKTNSSLSRCMVVALPVPSRKPR